MARLESGCIIDPLHVYYHGAIVAFVLGAARCLSSCAFITASVPAPTKTTHNTMLEVIWTVIPVIIPLTIAVPSMRLHASAWKTSRKVA